MWDIIEMSKEEGCVSLRNANTPEAGLEQICLK